MYLFRRVQSCIKLEQNNAIHLVAGPDFQLTRTKGVLQYRSTANLDQSGAKAFSCRSMSTPVEEFRPEAYLQRAICWVLSTNAFEKSAPSTFAPVKSLLKHSYKKYIQHLVMSCYTEQPVTVSKFCNSDVSPLSLQCTG